MTIPETTLTTIREALRSVDNHTVIRVLPPGHEDIPETKREKHPTMHFVRFHTPIADSKQRNDLQKRLSGMIVCADGILVSLANGDAPESEVKAEPDMATDPDIQREMAAIAAEEALPAPVLDSRGSTEGNPAPEAPIALGGKTVHTHTDAEPRYKTLVQTFKLNQPENRLAADKELNDEFTRGWRVLNIASTFELAVDNPTYMRVVTMEYKP